MYLLATPQFQYRELDIQLVSKKPPKAGGQQARDKTEFKKERSCWENN